MIHKEKLSSKFYKVPLQISLRLPTLAFLQEFFRKISRFLKKNHLFLRKILRFLRKIRRFPTKNYYST